MRWDKQIHKETYTYSEVCCCTIRKDFFFCGSAGICGQQIQQNRPVRELNQSYLLFQMFDFVWVMDLVLAFQVEEMNQKELQPLLITEDNLMRKPLPP